MRPRGERHIMADLEVEHGKREPDPSVIARLRAELARSRARRGAKSTKAASKLVVAEDADATEYEGMAGKPLKFVTVSEDKEMLTFTFVDGSEAQFRATGDCCSNSWIEHITVPDDVTGAELLGVTEACVECLRGVDDLIQVYHTKFRTARGDITIEYRNSSNGYYGGSLVRVRAPAHPLVVTGAR